MILHQGNRLKYNVYIFHSFDWKGINITYTHGEKIQCKYIYIFRIHLISNFNKNIFILCLLICKIEIDLFLLDFKMKIWQILSKQTICVYYESRLAANLIRINITLIVFALSSYLPTKLLT